MEISPEVEHMFSGESHPGIWDYIDKYAARILMLSFFVPRVEQSAASIAAALYFVFRSVYSKRVIPGSNYIWALAIGSYYLLNILAMPFTPAEYKGALAQLCGQRISLLLLPFAFAIIGQYFRALIMGEILYFVYGCLAVCMAGNADFIYHYLVSNGGMHAVSHVQYRMMFESFTHIHPTYMGMFLYFSICITLLLYPANDGVGKGIKYGLIYLLLVLLLSLLAKSPLIALIIACIHFAYTHRKTLYRYKMLIAGLLIVVIAACFFIPFVGQRIGEMAQFAGAGKAGNVGDNSMYVRQMIWNVDTDLLKQHWLTGVGPGRMLHMLDERYFFYSIVHNSPVGYYDPHNQYISDWLSFGILGIVLLLAVLVIHFIKAVRTGNQLYLYILILFFVTFFTETVLSRERGVLFYAVFTSLFFFYSKRPEKKQG